VSDSESRWLREARQRFGGTSKLAEFVVKGSRPSVSEISKVSLSREGGATSKVFDRAPADLYVKFGRESLVGQEDLAVDLVVKAGVRLTPRMTVGLARRSQGAIVVDDHLMKRIAPLLLDCPLRFNSRLISVVRTSRTSRSKNEGGHPTLPFSIRNGQVSVSKN